MNDGLIRKLKKSQFDTAYAISRGVSARMLGHYVKKGLLIRLSHGIYAFPQSLGFDYIDMVKEKISQIPQGVLGLRSALKIYGLTDESPQDIDLFCPASNIPKRKISDVRIHSVKDHLHKEGVTRVQGIPITTLERTIVDLMRKKGTAAEGFDILKEARRKGIKVDLPEILRLGEKFRVKWKAMALVGNA
jgi:predicted transcriptional regulator of viral defense system